MVEEAVGMAGDKVTDEETVVKAPTQMSSRAVGGEGVIIEAPSIGGMPYAATAT